MTSQVNPPVGVQPGDLEAEFTARGGNVCAGYCYPLCLEQYALISDDGVTVTLTSGGVGSMFSNIAGGVGAAGTDVYAGLFVIAMEDIADTKKGKCKVRGIVNAYVADSGNTAILAGKPLHVVAGSSPASYLNALAAASNASPRKFVGQALEANASTPSTPISMKVNFDGWHGFGGGQV
jgi:hypothetical protein